jgi:hypothetical protein
VNGIQSDKAEKELSNLQQLPRTWANDLGLTRYFRLAITVQTLEC